MKGGRAIVRIRTRGVGKLSVGDFSQSASGDGLHYFLIPVDQAVSVSFRNWWGTVRRKIWASALVEQLPLMPVVPALPIGERLNHSTVSDGVQKRMMDLGSMSQRFSRHNEHRLRMMTQLGFETIEPFFKAKTKLIDFNTRSRLNPLVQKTKLVPDEEDFYHPTEISS